MAVRGKHSRRGTKWKQPLPCMSRTTHTHLVHAGHLDCTSDCGGAEVGAGCDAKHVALRGGTRELARTLKGRRTGANGMMQGVHLMLGATRVAHQNVPVRRTHSSHRMAGASRHYLYCTDRVAGCTYMGAVYWRATASPSAHRCPCHCRTASILRRSFPAATGHPANRRRPRAGSSTQGCPRVSILDAVQHVL